MSRASHLTASTLGPVEKPPMNSKSLRRAKGAAEPWTSWTLETIRTRARGASCRSNACSKGLTTRVTSAWRMNPNSSCFVAAAAAQRVVAGQLRFPLLAEVVQVGGIEDHLGRGAILSHQGHAACGHVDAADQDRVEPAAVLAEETLQRRDARPAGRKDAHLVQAAQLRFGRIEVRRQERHAEPHRDEDLHQVHGPHRAGIAVGGGHFPIAKEQVRGMPVVIAGRRTGRCPGGGVPSFKTRDHARRKRSIPVESAGVAEVPDPRCRHWRGSRQWHPRRQ